MEEKSPHKSLLDALYEVQKLALKGPVRLEEVFHTLEGRGYPLMLIFLSLPFCLPVTIPGTSTPFGLMIAFMGLRVAFGHQMLWPKWLLNKEISQEAALKIVDKAIEGAKKLAPYLRPRGAFLVSTPIFHRFHGLFVCLSALFMSLPLPIPGTNMLAAIPIVLIGIALLEDDALFLILGYSVALIGLIYLLVLYLFGSRLLTSFMG